MENTDCIKKQTLIVPVLLIIFSVITKSKVTKAYFKTDDDGVAWTATVLSVGIAVSLIPGTILMENLKLKTTLLLATGTCLAASVLAIVGQDSFSVMLMSQAVHNMTYIFFVSLPGRLAVALLPHKVYFAVF